MRRSVRPEPVEGRTRAVCAAIVAAGGIGKRLRSRIHKSFVPLGGRPMLAWVLDALEGTREVDQIVLVGHRKDLPSAKRLIRRYRYRKVGAVVSGGESRMESVSCGLRMLPPSVKWVLVHDAARPLITPALIRATLRAARRSQAAIAAVPVVPTIKQACDGWVVKTLDRKRLWAVQTPQVFERKLLERAHESGRRSNLEATDDAALVERLGCRVRIVPGSERNIKVTTQEDLVVAEALMKNGDR